MFWISLGFALDPLACEAGGRDACVARFEDAASAVLAAAAEGGGFDPRYTPAMDTFAGLACAAGDALACSWSRAPYSEPAWPEGMIRVEGVPFPLPDGSWSFLAIGGEVGASGRYLPGAKTAARVGNVVVFGNDRHAGLLAIGPDGVDTAPADLGTDEGRVVAPTGKVLDLSADGTVLHRAVTGRLQRIDPDGVVHDLGDRSVDRARRLADGRVLVWSAKRTLALLDPDGVEQRVWTFPEDVWTHGLTVHPDGRSAALASLPQSLILPLDAPARLGTLSWPGHAELTDPGPPDPASFMWTVRDEDGQPLPGVFLDGHVSDAEGRVAQRDIVVGAPTLRLFVDGVPRYAAIDHRAHMATLLPLHTLPRPDVLDPDTLVDGNRKRVHVDRLPEALSLHEPFRAETHGPRLWATDGPDLRDAGSLFSIDPLTERDWTRHPLTVLTVVDEAGRPLVGVPVRVDHPRLAYTTHADLDARIRVWDADEVPFGPTAKGVTARREGDRLVLTGPPATPRSWVPRTPPVHGAWSGVDADQDVTVWIDRSELTPTLPGTGRAGLQRWLHDDDRLVTEDPAFVLHRSTPRPKNSKRWFTGRAHTEPGTRMVEEREGVGAPKRTVFTFTGTTDDLLITATPDGRVAPGTIGFSDGLWVGPDPDEVPPRGAWSLSDFVRTWWGVGGPLHGVQLERDVPTTRVVHARGAVKRLTWTYRGRERCGRTWCAIIEQQSDTLTARLLIEPDTLHLHRLDADTAHGPVSVRRTWESSKR